MNRVCVTLVTAGVLLFVGCRDYDFRLTKTIDDMKYRRLLEKELEKAPTNGLLQQEQIFVRPPKGLLGPTKTFTLTVVEPGKFDLENSFIDSSKQASLHVLARHKKGPGPGQKGKKTSEKPANRGDFNTDVIELMKTAYGADSLAHPKFKDVTRQHHGRENAFKELELTIKNKQLLVYLYGDKSSPYNVALIFEYPKSKWEMKPRVTFTLNTFAVGDDANRAFSGGGEEGL